ncbi:hypothetical protein [Gynuella sp.]|uniref:hypothetical protein n=1 Tax=Gynuella sp. TaxID=2969146 RepID=UPI003D0C492E
MGICASELKNCVIKPTLEYFGVWNEAHEALLIATAATESDLGYHLGCSSDQGYGLFNITEQEHNNIWDNYLAQTPDLASKVRGLAGQRSFLEQPHLELSTNLAYSTAIAWFMYESSGIPVPAKTDVIRIAEYWCKNFHPSREFHDKVKFVHFLQAWLKQDSIAA